MQVLIIHSTMCIRIGFVETNEDGLRMFTLMYSMALADSDYPVYLSPMLYGLYEQYDASGGRQTYNGFITSGIRFYFWTQSFGRLTGESTWSNDTGPFYFIYTFLWAFLPWSLSFPIALVKKTEEDHLQRTHHQTKKRGAHNWWNGVPIHCILDVPL